LAYGVVIGSMKVKEHFFDHPQAPDTQTVEKAASADKIHAQKTAELAKIHAKILQPNMMAVKRVQKVKKVVAKKVAKQAIKASAKVHDNAIPHLRSTAKTVKMKHQTATVESKQKKVTVKKSTVKKVAAKKVNLSTTKRKASKPRDNAVPHLRKRAAANAKKTPKATKATQEEKVALNIEKLKAEKAAVEIEGSGQQKVTKNRTVPKVKKVVKQPVAKKGAETREEKEEEEIKKVEHDALTEVRKRVEAAEEAEVASMNHAKEAKHDDAAIESLTKVLTSKDLKMVPVESFEQSVPLNVPTPKKTTAKKPVAAPKKIVGVAAPQKENSKVDDEILAMETELLKDEALHPNDGTKDSIKKLLSSEVNHDEMNVLSSAETELLGV